MSVIFSPPMHDFRCVFSVYISQGAKQNGITLDKAIERIQACGIKAIDVGTDELEIAQHMRKTGMHVASVYGVVNFLDDDYGENTGNELLLAAKTLDCCRVMALPQPIPDSGDYDACMSRTIEGFRKLVEKAHAAGITVTVENFGAANSPCAKIGGLKELFDEVPDLKFTLDTGNFMVVGAGDDPLEAMKLFRDRIVHCHIKDFYEGQPKTWCPFGDGCIPNEQIVQSLVSSGYTGYFTLEGRLAPDFLKATEESERKLSCYLRSTVDHGGKTGRVALPRSC